MESLSNDQSEQYPDAVAARRVMQDAQGRMASRVRSAWWVHGLRALLIGITVFGIAGRPEGAAWLVPAGVLGLAVIGRWRTSSVGFSRANPERWAFLRLGAPWSVVVLAVVVVAMAFLIVEHHLPLWQVAVVALVSAAVTAVCSPLADRAARRRVERDLVGGLDR
ncbi:hypothetical protein [Curtobacterium sp. Leaf261]|uniref:hypothetical protein n=1 Tax=Curtobacterium sp. Leaf261 TaxID=1736311 RepID=UPI0006FCF48F|nr:hypothetical protein [Curtobacterium sp. Leaf261]KQO63451.1 hypothetical protein ASF23_04135 [Curtobacterium sp. Leaf261]